MLKLKLLFVLFAFAMSTWTSLSQTVVWSDYFQNSCASNCTANGYNDGSGPWTITNTGFNGADANLWYVSGAECGNAATQCGTGCGTTDPSLHIGSNTSVFGDMGASYLAGDGGFGIYFPTTDARVESPVINLTGQTTLTLNFNYIENGQAAIDDASLWYFDGSTWTLLNTLAKTALTCNPQGTWTAFSVALPASANNNANVKIGFRWINNNDDIGTDPSFAVDDIEITTPAVGSPPVANFTTTTTTICEGTCIDFTNTSTFGANPVFSWDFGNTLSSSLEDPTGICYNTSGTYTVTLTVTDDNGTDTEAKVNYIVVNDALSAGNDNTATVCNTSSINVSTLLASAAPGGVWAETTAVASGQFNTSTAVFNAAGLSIGDYTFSYTVNSVAPCPSDQAIFTITVNDCTNGPTAIIAASNGTVCQGQSLIFNSASTGTNVDQFVWSFGGGFPGTANTAGPHSVIFNTVGNFDVWLEVTDDFGTHDTTITIQVVSCSTPTAAFGISDNDPCAGDCISFDNNSSSISLAQYSWTFEGGLPPTSSSPNPPLVCYSTPGTYNVTLVVTNSFGTGSYSQNVTVLDPPTITAFNDAVIDLGDTVTIGAITTGADISWSWTPNTQGTVLDCTISDCSEAEVFPVITTTYTATATTNEGCTASDFVIISVNIPEGGYAIGVPNSFSPNGDGKNDQLFVDGLGMTSMVFRVYNRYGQLVFESTDQNIGWNGTFNQEELNPATFAWTLEFNLVSGTAGKMNGNVTLLK